MDFYILKDILTQKKLPGWSIQKELAPSYRGDFSLEEIKAKKPQKASVLIVLYKKKDHFFFPVILRTIYKGVHSGQIGLPGGKREKRDLTQEYTALRETFEELGLLKEKIEIIKKMTPLYVPPSNFYVYPYIAFYKDKNIEFLIDKNEVQKVYEIEMNKFLYQTPITTLYKHNKQVPAFIYNDLEIWGATAMILNECKVLLKSDIFTGF